LRLRFKELPSIRFFESHKEKEMVAFRKLFPVLAIVALLLGSSTANAQIAGQTPLTCIANAGVPPLVRAEGLTELVGDLVLVCTGGNPASPFLANFQLFLNTNITSRLLGSDLSEALLLIDEPLVPRADAPGGGAATPSTPLCLAPSGQNSAVPPIVASTTTTCNPGINATTTSAGTLGQGPTPGNASTYQRGSYTAFRATTTGQQNAIVWPGIPVVPPGSTGSRVFRITNVRANASVIGAATTLIPNQITAFISVSASQSLAINNPQQTVAYVQRGLVFDVRNCANSGGANNPSLAQCVNFNADVFRNPNRTGSTTSTFAVRFTEGFQTAFKRRIEEAGNPPQTESVPGVVYNTESGFVRTTAGTGSDAFGIIGVANSGTRVAARFRDIPADVALFVTVQSVASGAAQARLVQTGPNGEGGTLALAGGAATTLFPTAATTNLSCGGVTPAGPAETPNLNAAQVPVVNGQGLAVWEITAANPSAIDTLLFYVAAAYVANPSTPSPAVGQARVSGSFAPFYTGANDVANAAGRASTTLPIPRFLETTDLVNTFRIDACETNLLFPFVTAQSGFDTGIAISNTSADHFANPQERRQGGRCTINYFGNVTGGGNAPNAQTTNADIPAGGQLTFVVSSGGNFGIAGTPGFQGYIFARCLFRFAHGFAFVTDGPIGQARVAEGYLALVVDGAEENDRPRGVSFGENLGH
jgi:hypothetical protein